MFGGLERAFSARDSDRSQRLAQLPLLRIGAVVIRNTRRIRLPMSSTYRHQDLLRTVALRLNSS